MSAGRRRGGAVCGLLAVGALLGMALGGCQNKPEAPPLVAVKGRVIKTGNEPVPWILVAFHSRGPAGVKSYRAGTGKDGHFELRCPAGSYRVTLTPLPIKTPDSGPGAKTAPGKTSAIPGRYGSADKTPLTVEVPAEGKSDVVLEVR